MGNKNKLDHLTGLHTRDILDNLERRFSAIADETWSLALIDIDHFKLVNDVFGHIEGDGIIRRVASILSRNKRKTDILLRYGGDEFLIIMPGTELTKAVNQGERILQALEREVFQKEMKIGLSIGVAESIPADHYITDILKRTDKALYQAKRGGRGRVSFYEDHKQEITKKSITFEHFVGRNSELLQLRNVLDNTLSGKGNFVLISGEPGIGKTRLTNELEHYASFKNCLVLNSKCDELGTDRPYLLLTDPIDANLKILPEEALNELREALPTLLPQTAELFPDLNLKSALMFETTKNSVLRLRMYSEIAQIMLWMASRQPVIFTVDNLHWISDHDFDLLAYLTRAATNASILFLATIINPTKNSSEIEKKLRNLSSSVKYKLIKLKSLDEEYTRHMVMFALRDPNIPRDILNRLVRQCSGNPLYLRELLLSLHECGAIKYTSSKGWSYHIHDDMPLPNSVSVLMKTRLSGLTSFQKEVLCVGSMTPGGSFFLNAISAVLNKDKLEIAKTLAEPLRIGIILEQLSEHNSLKYHFAHDTMRTFLYQNLSLGVRKTLQSRFGLYYENMYDQGDSAAIARAAHHYCDSFDSEKARYFALLAEKQARTKGAIRESFRWLKQYMNFADIARENPLEAFNARIKLGTLFNLFADYDGALKILTEAATIAENNYQLGRIRFQKALLHSKRGDYSKAVELYDQAIDMLPRGEERIKATFLMAYLQDLLISSSDGLTLLEKVYEEIEAIQEPNVKQELLADYYTTHGSIAQDKKPQIENTRSCLKAVSLFRLLSDKAGEAKALLNTAISMRMTSNYETRINFLNDGLKILTEVGDTHSTIVAYINLGETYFSAMQYDLAKDYFDLTIKQVEITGLKPLAVWGYHFLGRLDNEAGNLSNAKINYNISIKLAEELGITGMAITSKIYRVFLLMKQKNYEQANIELLLLESHQALHTIEASKRRILLGLRGAERLNNPTVERTKALREAEEKLIAATIDMGNYPSLQEIAILATLMECLYEQNKRKAYLAALSKAETFLDIHLKGIANDLYRQAFLNSETVKTFADLKKLNF